MHTPYTELTGRLPDFRVKYRFYTTAEGGRQSLPYQGYRCDFWYDHPNHLVKHLFMIWPEFENSNGSIIREDDARVPKEGTATMWIVNGQAKPYHKERITVGTKGWFREGDKTTGECEVIEILALQDAE